MDGCKFSEFHQGRSTRRGEVYNRNTNDSLVNEFRVTRVGEVLSDFRTLQYYIAAAPTDPANTEDYYTEGWAALRQCTLDGQHILNCAADTSVPQAGGGPHEQEKAELKQSVPRDGESWRSPADQTRRCLLDSFARRHECQKIYLRQAAAQRWISNRDGVLQGGRPNARNQAHLMACDQQLRAVSSMAHPPCFQELGNFPSAKPQLTRLARSLRQLPTRQSTTSCRRRTSPWAAGRQRTRACGVCSDGSAHDGRRIRAFSRGNEGETDGVMIIPPSIPGWISAKTLAQGGHRTRCEDWYLGILPDSIQITTTHSASHWMRLHIERSRSKKTRDRDEA